MNEILLTRVDSRLSHGKVADLWTKHTGADTVVIANDKINADSFSKNLMDLTIPFGINSAYTSVEGFKEYFDTTANKKILLIVQDVEDLKRIVDMNLPIKAVDLGIMHTSYGKKQLTDEIAVDEEDIEMLTELLDCGIDIFIQTSPNSSKRNFGEFVSVNA